MVAHLVDKFRTLQSEITDRIEHYDTLEFQSLDIEIAEVFEEIFLHVPTSGEEAQIMAAFLLEVMSRNDTGDNFHMIERIRTLLPFISNAAPHESATGVAYGIGI